MLWATAYEVLESTNGEKKKDKLSLNDNQGHMWEVKQPPVTYLKNLLPLVASGQIYPKGSFKLISPLVMGQTRSVPF